MTPTNKLRFVARIEKTDTNITLEDADGMSISLYADTVRVLQQWWAVERSGQITPDGEWRDVPLEVE
jgi:hypothetical protein